MVAVLIPAAGMGRRMGSDRNKLLIPILQQPVIAWTLQAAAAASLVDWIGLICQPTDEPDLAPLAQALGITKPVVLIRGGETRQESVYCGLKGLPPGTERVLIHDGARCLATPELFDRCAQALEIHRGLIAAIPVKDTIKVVHLGEGEPVVAATPDRATLWAAQTPQGFAVAPLLAAHDQAIAQGWAVTDDAALFERVGIPVAIVAGEETNLKVTTPGDLAIATWILQQRPQP